MNLAGLGYIAGGLGSGLDAGTRLAMERLQMQQLRQQQAGQGDAGRALMSLSGVTPPAAQPQGLGALGGLLQGVMGGRQTATPQAMPQPQQQAALQAAASQPQQQATPPPQLQAAAFHLDFPTLTKALAQMPGMTPERLMGALSSLQPYMNTQAKIDFQNAMIPIRREQADAAMSRANTYGQTAPIMAGASAQRAATGAANEASLEGARANRIQVDQAKLDQGQRHLEQIDRSAAAKDLAGAELNYRALQTSRANAVLAAHGDENDPTVKGIDEQVSLAKAKLAELRAMPSQHPNGWEGKSTGRAEPEVAQPMKPKGKVSVDNGAAPSAPKPGDVMQGYRFKGGDPSKKENWEKV